MLVPEFGCLVSARFAWRFVRPCFSQLAGRFADFVLCAPDHLVQRAMGFLGCSVSWGGHKAPLWSPSVVGASALLFHPLGSVEPLGPYPAQPIEGAPRKKGYACSNLSTGDLVAVLRAVFGK